jgi:phage terminase large subunit
MSTWLGNIDNTIIVDSARPEVIRLLRDQGYTVRPSRKGAGSVIRGIDKLQKFKKIVFGAGTEEAYEEFCKLGFDDNDNLMGSRDFVDAVRYGVERLGGFTAIKWGDLYARV